MEHFGLCFAKVAYSPYDRRNSVVRVLQRFFEPIEVVLDTGREETQSEGRGGEDPPLSTGFVRASVEDTLSELVQKAPECRKGMVLAGYPMNVEETNSLAKAMEVHAVLSVELPEDTAIRRSIGQWVHEPSGRVYHEVLKPPKFFGLDDFTGQKLNHRPERCGAAPQVKIAEDAARARHRLHAERALRVKDFYRARKGVEVIVVPVEADPVTTAHAIMREKGKHRPWWKLW